MLRKNKTKNNLNRKIVGFDINKLRINQLNRGFDSTNEVEKNKIQNLSCIEFTYKLEKIAFSDVFIIMVWGSLYFIEIQSLCFSWPLLRQRHACTLYA